MVINPTLADKVERHVDRIKTLDGAIEKAKAKGNKDRVKSLQEERDRRENELQSVRDMLNG